MFTCSGKSSLFAHSPGISSYISPLTPCWHSWSDRLRERVSLSLRVCSISSGAELHSYHFIKHEAFSSTCQSSQCLHALSKTCVYYSAFSLLNSFWPSRRAQSVSLAPAFHSCWYIPSASLLQNNSPPSPSLPNYPLSFLFPGRQLMLFCQSCWRVCVTQQLVVH